MRRWRLLKLVLKQIYVIRLLGKKADLEAIAEGLGLDEGYVAEALDVLADRRMVELKSGEFHLNWRGREQIKVVLAGGVFDIIHPGHDYFLKEAKALGDLLVVSVARDKTVLRFRGRKAMHEEGIRLELVSSIRYVDCAILGSETDIFNTVLRVRPDVIALGYDQKHDELELKRRAQEAGLKLEVLRLDSPFPGMKSSEIKRKGELNRI